MLRILFIIIMGLRQVKASSIQYGSGEVYLTIFPILFLVLSSLARLETTWSSILQKF